MSETTEYRPIVHYTPPKGWMNDPNGLVYTNGLWHLYYQYTPDELKLNNPSWGHATSPDLIHWTTHPIAIKSDPPNDQGIFSGSAVIDSENTSGLFDETVKKSDRVVAIYTLNTSEKQTQEIAYSTDGGYTFTKYAGNPVIDVGSAQFRDPKVIWHAPTSKWVMAVVLSQKYRVVFYGSKDLLNWEELSTFEGGFYGYQYECPALTEIKIQGTSKTKWVLFIGINPGAPLGGSATQYFVGDFNGTVFIPDNHQARVADFGMDFYAFQTWFNPETTDTYGLAWASNWQYGQNVPTYPWRSKMSIPRKYTLKTSKYNDEYSALVLAQEPVDLTVGKSVNSTQVPLTLNGQSGAFLFDLEVELVKSSDISDTTLYIHVESKDGSNKLLIGVDLSNNTIYVDRHTNPKAWSHPLYNEKIGTYVQPQNEIASYKVKGIIDKTLLELFIDDGTTTLTNEFYFDNGSYPEIVRINHTTNSLSLRRASISEIQ